MADDTEDVGIEDPGQRYFLVCGVLRLMRAPAQRDGQLLLVSVRRLLAREPNAFLLHRRELPAAAVAACVVACSYAYLARLFLLSFFLGLGTWFLSALLLLLLLLLLGLFVLFFWRVVCVLGLQCGRVFQPRRHVEGRAGAGRHLLRRQAHPCGLCECSFVLCLGVCVLALLSREV